jgi:hypothetical protein
METIPEKRRFDIPEIYRLLDAGHTQGAVARQVHCSQSYVSRLEKARRLQGAPREPDATPVNGHLPAIPAAHPDALQRTSALPVHSDASALDEIRDRLATLEAFMAVIQSAHHSASERISALPAHQDAPAHRSTPERTAPPTWKSQGQQFAEDTLQRLDQYARQSRREKREIIDTALRAYLAQLGQEGGGDA